MSINNVCIVSDMNIHMRDLFPYLNVNIEIETLGNVNIHK